MLWRSNCLYCGRKLSWRKRIGKLQFCSEEHQSIHRRESDMMAIARLDQAASTDYGVSSWKMAESGDVNLQIHPPLSASDAEALLALHAALGPLAESLTALAAALAPPKPAPPPRLKPRLLLTAGEHQK